jgi:hypothetical protein
MKYDLENAKLVWKTIGELKTDADPRHFYRHLKEIGDSANSPLGIVEPIIIDQSDNVVAGNSRAKSKNGKIPCLQVPMDEEAKRLVAWITNNIRYPTAKHTDAVYIHENVQQIMKDYNCSKIDAITKIAEWTGVEENTLKQHLANYRPMLVEAIEQDTIVPESKKVNPSVGEELANISKSTRIPISTLETMAKSNSLTVDRARVMERYTLSKIELKTPMKEKITALEQMMKDVKNNVVTVEVTIRKEWKETIQEMAKRAMANYYKETGFSDEDIKKQLNNKTLK